MKLEPISKALWGRGAGCSSGVGNYLLSTVGHGCRLFKWCQNLPPGHCGAVVQVIQAVSETSSPALWGRGASCLSGVGITSWTLWGRGAGRLSGVGTYLTGTVRQGYRLFKGCQSLPPGHCRAGVQAV